MMPEERKKMRDGMLDTELEPELTSALRNFRLSAHAWSEAAYNRPRTAAAPVRTAVWRRATGWAMGCVLVLAAASGGVYEHGRQMDQERARQAKVAEQQAEQRRAAAVQAAEDEDALLTRVDSDIARKVPAAMDPLAGLADVESSTKR